MGTEKVSKEQALGNSNVIEEQKKYIETIMEINSNKDIYYCILTMGCKLNENDSEKLSRNDGANGV